MRFLVVNSKGGSGKTTFALNAAVPLLLSMGAERVNYIDVDVANKEALNVSSPYLETHLWKPEDLKERRIPRRSVIDVGGNLNALQTLDVLDKTEKLRRIDLVAIPLAKGEQDAYNAVEVYKKLKDYGYNGKILFVLSQVVELKNYKREFFEFFGFGTFEGVVKEVDEGDLNLFLMPYSNELRRVKAIYGKTVFDFVSENHPKLEEFVQKLFELEEELDQNPSPELEAKYEMLSDLIYSTKVLKSLWEERLKPQIEKVKELLEG